MSKRGRGARHAQPHACMEHHLAVCSAMHACHAMPHWSQTAQRLGACVDLSGELGSRTRTTGGAVIVVVQTVLSVLHPAASHAAALLAGTADSHGACGDANRQDRPDREGEPVMWTSVGS